MDIQKISINKINPAPYNPRADLQPGDTEYEKLKKSLEEFDLIEPLIWNKKSGNLVGGHQRLKILKEQGVEVVDVSVVNLEMAKEKALNLALNKISGEWDMPKLKDLLEEIDTGEFDIEVTGFDEDEIETLMLQVHQDILIGEDEDSKTAAEVSGEIIEELSNKISSIAAQHPGKLNQALSVIVPLKKGNEVVIITDPLLKDFITEVKRYVDNGEFSPLEAILNQTVKLKWK